MTRKQLELRMKANIARYINNDKKTCVDTIMELYSRIPDVGGNVKPLYRYRSLNQYEISSLENETIFMRWPSSYDDKSDCTPVFDIKEISEYIVKKKYSFLDLKRADKDLIKAEGIMEDPRFVKKIDEMRNMWMIACFTEMPGVRRSCADAARVAAAVVPCGCCHQAGSCRALSCKIIAPR